MRKIKHNENPSMEGTLLRRVRHPEGPLGGTRGGGGEAVSARRTETKVKVVQSMVKALTDCCCIRRRISSLRFSSQVLPPYSDAQADDPEDRRGGRGNAAAQHWVNVLSQSQHFTAAGAFCRIRPQAGLGATDCP